MLDTAVDRVTVTDDPDTVLRGIVDGAVAGIPAVDHASVTVWDPAGRIVRAAASDDDAARLRAAQADLDEGPGIDARTGGVTVVVHDLAADGRWTAFGPLAREHGVRSVVAVPLRCGWHTGALTLWSRAVAAFDEPGQVLGELFGRYASIAVDSAEIRGDLRRAIERRDVIGQAKGILMVDRGVGPDEAFRILARRSQQENTKVADIARRLVAERLGAPTGPRGDA
nr:GAF and ANTAR domain-containing protein [Pseudonocardia sp. C8]